MLKPFKKLLPRKDNEIDGEDRSTDSTENEEIFSNSEDEYLYHNQSADFMIFKLALSADLPAEYSYQVRFLDFDQLNYPNDDGLFSLIFPMSRHKLYSSMPPVEIQAIAEDTKNVKGICSLNISEEIAILSKQLDSAEAFPITCEVAEDVPLLDEHGNDLATVNFKLALSCLGRSVVTDASMPPICSQDYAEPVEEEPVEYDEYTARVNGHTLNIHMKKNARNKSNKARRVGESQKEAAPAKQGSQLVFQMPTTQQLCSKNPGNMSYSMQTCKEREHEHEQGAVRVSPGASKGNAGAGDDTDSDCFIIALGRRGIDGKGRLELKLKAPKPKVAEDFRKPMRDSGTQTESAEKPPKKGKKKP